ncbi:MAG: imidazole glycerol phosphate synthase subunit HisH [Leptospiraceae bacterium]|nr:imidazole glycerol phosphate synthase subunit HisH [Leptospiraceae bacterium]MCP5495200.1 imidazole glycerol phosphate synthase subunit HisH [Leptospiraceae bacterium]
MIAVIDFGMGNIHSCLKAISLFTPDCKLTNSALDIKEAKGIILPGDGAFESAMKNLDKLGLIKPLNDFVKSGRPIFGICIGYQIFFEESEESREKGKLVKGLGFIKGKIKLFHGKPYKVPHMGWNKLIFKNSKKEKRLLKDVSNGAYMYFIHSFRPVSVNKNAVVATCSYYEEEFPVIIEKNNLYGTQFHPEKSDKDGLKILKNFIDIV